MKKRLLSALLAVAACTAYTFGQQVTVDGLTYQVLSETDKTAELYSGSEASGDVVVPATITFPASDEFEGGVYSVTSVGYCSFQSNTSLTSISMPSVTSIESYAFYGCSQLASVDLSAVTSIGDYAFNQCSNICSLRIGSVEQWCKVGFGEVASPLQNSLQTVNLYIGNSQTPTTNLVVPNTVKEIPNYAFSRTKIVSVSGSAPASLGDCAFYICDSLSSVSLPCATSIGAYAFWGSHVKTMSIPSVTSIGRDCFNSSLCSIDLSSIEFIDIQAFSNCYNISSLRIGSIEQWFKVYFKDHPLSYTTKSVALYIGNCDTPITTLLIPNTITEIPAYAFKNTTIKEVYAPSVSDIGHRSFSGCTNLSALSIPSVTSISSAAFEECNNINSLRIGSLEQWCNADIKNDSYYGSGNPLRSTTQEVDLYIGDSITPTTIINLPNSVKSIPDYAFQKTKISRIIAPSAESIGHEAFCACHYLVSAKLFAAKSIQKYTFLGCESLTSVELPFATILEESAFYNCLSLQAISLPSLTTINDNVFGNCNSLVSLSLPSLTYLGNRSLPSTLKYLSVPKVEKFAKWAFEKTSLDTLCIGSAEQYCNIEYENSDENSWDYFNQFPFGPYNHNHIANIFVGDSQTPATEISIPASVRQVPDFAFKGTSIHTIHFEGINPPSLVNTRSFPEWTMLAVPGEAYETYLAAEVYKTIPLQGRRIL